MSRRSFKAEQIMSRYRPIAPKPSGSSSSRSALVPARAPASNNVNCINSTSRVCKKRSGSTSTSARRGRSSSSTSPSSCISRTLVPKLSPVYTQALLERQQLWQCEAPRESLKTLPLLPNTPATHSTSSTSETSTSTSSTEPALETLTELSLRFGDTHHSTSRTGSFTLSSASTTELAPLASSVDGKGFTANAPKVDFETRLFEQAYAACPEPVALTDENGSVVWCNPAYRETVRRSDEAGESSEELGLPVPLYCFGSGAVLWVFWRKFFSPVGLPVCEPMKPLAVRASCENLLANLKNQTC